jgi:hypothetical protein
MGRYPPLNAGSSAPWQQWPFRGFRSCRGVRGPNVNRVTRVTDTRYAVGSKAGVHLDERPDSPPVGWKIPFFFIKILHAVQNFYEKEKKSTMLPQAILPFTG